jgi:hypothetical protein
MESVNEASPSELSFKDEEDLKEIDEWEAEDW